MAPSRGAGRLLATLLSIGLAAQLPPLVLAEGTSAGATKPVANARELAAALIDNRISIIVPTADMVSRRVRRYARPSCLMTTPDSRLLRGSVRTLPAHVCDGLMHLGTPHSSVGRGDFVRPARLCLGMSA